MNTKQFAPIAGSSTIPAVPSQRAPSHHRPTTMSYRINPAVEAVTPPPIADVFSWVEGRRYPAERPLLDVSQAVPSYPPPDALVEHVGRVAREPETAVYSPILGLPALRAALSRHLIDDYQIDPTNLPVDRVAITAGCNQAFCVTMNALAGPGDEVVLPLPYYFNHQMWLDMQGIRPVGVPFNPARGGLPSVDEVAAALTPRTRAIAVVTPNNPTGSVYPPDLLDDLHQLALEREVALVVDETYKDFRPDGATPAHRLFDHARWTEAFVHLFSFSKAYSLTGYRVGAVVCGPRLMAAVEKVLDCLTICAPRVSQEAARYALENLSGWRDDKAQLMRARVDALQRAFRRNDLRYELVSCGAYFAYIRHPFSGQAARDVARRLAAECNLLCVPGDMFGPGQESYLRFAFANLEAEQFPALVQRLIDSQD